MDRVSAYLEIVPLPVLLGAPLVALLMFFLVPGRFRLDLALIGMVVTLTIGRLPDLGVVATVAKVGESGVILLVVLAALMDPAPKRSTTPWTGMYVVMAAVSFIFILTVSEFPTALALRVQWLLVVIAAAFTARTVVDEHSVLRIGRALAIGFCLSLLLPLAALLRDPASAFHLGLGRFEPWGSSSNQIGIMFSQAAALALFAAWKAPKTWLRFGFLGFATMAGGMGLLTASRSTVFVMLALTFPVVLHFIRRPLFALAGLVIVGAGLAWFLGFSEAGSLDRLGSLDTAREETAALYLDIIISERPLLGLLETSGESALSNEDVGLHPHNAYIETAYLGGIVYALPMFVLVGVTMFSTITVWLRRKEIPFDPLIINFLSILMMMVYAHGFVNGAIYYPTYTWAFMHIVLSMTFITWARDIRRGESLVISETWDDGYMDQPAEYDSLHAPVPW